MTAILARNAGENATRIDRTDRAARRTVERNFHILRPEVAKLLMCLAFTITALGVAQSIVTRTLGTDTVLRDLRHFNLDAERNVGAWFSSLLLAMCGACGLLVARVFGRSGNAAVRQWYAVGIVFFILSLDETAGFHEVVDAPLREHFDLTGLFYNPWVFIALVITAGFAVFMLPLLVSVPARTAALFVLSGAIFVGGAAGMEPLDAWAEYARGAGSVQQIVFTTIEETLEMLGLCLFLYALLDFMKQQRVSVHVL